MTKLSTNQAAVLSKALSFGCVIVGRDCAGNTFSSLVKAGLLTRSADGTPEPGFWQCVHGAEGFITTAGRAAL